jgi:hypothetical protein
VEAQSGPPRTARDFWRASEDDVSDYCALMACTGSACHPRASKGEPSSGTHGPTRPRPRPRRSSESSQVARQRPKILCKAGVDAADSLCRRSRPTLLWHAMIEVMPPLPSGLPCDSEHRRDLSPGLSVPASGANCDHLRLIEESPNQTHVRQCSHRGLAVVRMARHAPRQVVVPTVEPSPRSTCVLPRCTSTPHACQGNLTAG